MQFAQNIWFCERASNKPHSHHEWDAMQNPTPLKQPRLASYDEFWRFYLREHARPATRGLHYVGTSLTVLCLLAAIVTANPWFLLAMIVLGYAPAWLGHFTVERNRPATFRYPVWSLISDFRLYAVWISGRLPRELEMAGIDS
jgi:hypothetical protein